MWGKGLMFGTTPGTLYLGAIGARGNVIILVACGTSGLVPEK